MKTLLLLGTIAASGLVACGGSTPTASTTSTSSSSSTPAASAAATAAATPAVQTAKAAASPLAAWCSLSLGESKGAVLAAMGIAPNGHAADSYRSLLGPGESQAEWDTAGDILLASFDASGKASNLQAYAGAIGPQGATNISCPAFRH